MQNNTKSEPRAQFGFFSRKITLADLENSDFMRYANEDIRANSTDLESKFDRVMSKLQGTVSAGATAQ